MLLWVIPIGMSLNNALVVIDGEHEISIGYAYIFSINKECVLCQIQNKI